VSLAEVGDGSPDDFSAGAAGAGARVARTVAGEVTLAPAVAAEFTGPALPAGWTVTPFHDGGSAELVDGAIRLDGAWVGCDDVFAGPRALEFVATFAARPDQHVGFGTNCVDVPWLMLSTKWGRRLYLRTHLLSVEDKRLSAEWFEAPHHFRIDWNLMDVVVTVDGDRVVRTLVPVPGFMRALAANQRLGGPPLTVEWMRVTPYAPAGRFTSRVLDTGRPVAWGRARWTAERPEGTSLTVQVRTGDSRRPGRGWSPWRTVAAPGHEVAGRSRYLQYRAALASADPGRTPVLREVRVAYRPSAGPG
jgi:hypothetical protein